MDMLSSTFTKKGEEDKLKDYAKIFDPASAVTEWWRMILIKQ
jgi:hypothetical protein